MYGVILGGSLYQKRDLGQEVTAVIPNKPVCQCGRGTGRGIRPVPGGLPPMRGLLGGFTDWGNYLLLRFGGMYGGYVYGGFPVP